MMSPDDTKPAQDAPEKPAPSPSSSSSSTAATTPPPKPAAAQKPAPPKPAAAQKPAPPKPAAAQKPAPPPPPPRPKPTVAAKPPAEPAEPPAFEKGISDRLAGEFGQKVEVTSVKKDRIAVSAGMQDVHGVAEFARDALNYDHVESVSGVDRPQDGEIEVVYHIGSYSDPALAGQVLALSTRAKREESPIPGNDATRLPSLRDVFYSVEFHEREVFEMFGVHFEGHPDNRRLLLPEDWADLPPLRKDFAIKGR